MARREGYDKSFASPADYDDGFVMSDTAKAMKDEAIRRNMNRNMNKNNENQTENKNKFSLVLSEKPITKCSADKNQTYSDYYWKCSDREREEMLKLMDEYGYNEDDYDDSRIEYEYTERDAMKPPKDKYDAIVGFIEQTARYDINVEDSSMIDTGRYVEIEVYYAGVPTSEQLNLNDRYDKSNQPYTPDAVIIAYESIPKNGVHEFWQVDPKDSSDHVKYLERDKYNIKHTLSSEEAAKYQDVRDGIAFRQQVRSGVFPKNLLELATKCKENDDSKPNGRSVSKIGPSV